MHVLTWFHDLFVRDLVSESFGVFGAYMVHRPMQVGTVRVFVRLPGVHGDLVALHWTGYARADQIWIAQFGSSSTIVHHVTTGR